MNKSTQAYKNQRDLTERVEREREKLKRLTDVSLNLLFIHKQVLADLPEMYDGKENKSSPTDEKAQELIDRNKLYVSTYFNILSMMNQRVPQIAQLFRQLAPSYVVFSNVGENISHEFE